MAGPWSGDVSFNVLDGQAGVVEVPSQTVQAVLGCCTGGVVNQVAAMAQLATIPQVLGYGPLTEACGTIVQAGGVVLAVKMPAATPGAINNVATAVGGGIASSTNASPIEVTMTTPHGLVTGDVVTIAGHAVNTNANGTWVVAVTGASTFTLRGSTGNGVGGATGTATFIGAVATMVGTAVPFFAGTPIDDYYPMVVCQTGFAVGTAGGSVLVSLDAGRTFGPPLAVGTGTTIALKDVGGMDTGLVLHLGAATTTWTGGGIVGGKPVGDYVRASTTAPQPNDTGISAALGALVAYVAGTTSSFPLIQVVGNMASTDATAFESGGTTNLDNMATQYLFERGIMSARDVAVQAAWGGLTTATETETLWINALLADFSATIAKRVVVTAGHYNMPSAFPTQFASSPIYRRPFSFALGAREVAIQPQTHAGKVGQNLGGALTQIVINPTTDPQDGFIYHDERLRPAFDYFLPGGVGRLASARTHARKQGFFAADPLTLAQTGSDYALLPMGLVIDQACNAAYAALVNFVDADFTTNANGTLSDSAANTVKGAVEENIGNLKGVGMISGYTVVVDQTQNIQITKKLLVTVNILGVAYILEIDVNIGFVTSLPVAA